MPHYTFDHWEDGPWHVGRLQERPHIVSQGRTLEELQANIADAHDLVLKHEASENAPVADGGGESIPLSQFLIELGEAGCLLKTHDGLHDLYFSRKTGRHVPVPRHPEISPTLAHAIRKQLGIVV